MKLNRNKNEIPFDFDLSMGTNPNKDFWTEDFSTYELAKNDDEIYSKLIEIILNDDEYIEKYKIRACQNQADRMIGNAA